jgi:Ran-binding protein 1
VDFKPLVSLEEVKVKTMEEDEEVIFKMCARALPEAHEPASPRAATTNSHQPTPAAPARRAKLFRWESDSWEKEVKMWKERGTGDVRFLKHKETGETRVLMRREKTMKICANFMCLPSIELKENAGSDRSWVWKCNDFSEEKNEPSVLAIRFANSESTPP